MCTWPLLYNVGYLCDNLLYNKVERNPTCQNVGVKMLKAERLIMIKPKILSVDINSHCLTKLRAVEIVRLGMLNCSDFATFPLIIIKRRIFVSIDFSPDDIMILFFNNFKGNIIFIRYYTSCIPPAHHGLCLKNLLHIRHVRQQLQRLPRVRAMWLSP